MLFLIQIFYFLEYGITTIHDLNIMLEINFIIKWSAKLLKLYTKNPANGNMYDFSFIRVSTWSASLFSKLVDGSPTPLPMTEKINGQVFVAAKIKKIIFLVLKNPWHGKSNFDERKKTIYLFLQILLKTVWQYTTLHLLAWILNAASSCLSGQTAKCI